MYFDSERLILVEVLCSLAAAVGSGFGVDEAGLLVRVMGEALT